VTLSDWRTNSNQQRRREKSLERNIEQKENNPGTSLGVSENEEGGKRLVSLKLRGIENRKEDTGGSASGKRGIPTGGNGGRRGMELL